ncbi:Pimeloyl-ACP methyl ester carboxylesterase [Flexibacter flexilis DSM 6793]|uniref:Pimeloyl-ACP methyl ester carboxylesterase n=1 Tax=Flexibacter flexilis DSM 6793 TaxID=927664 RepID=A0A1I1I1P9_9BACT|nr:alpha/beta hydrolase [Flexibacter flexilis]SFC30124.1 Pimeloyl-ACP methyl ester carboxylesterase [Flexibacter flexilis DSM 6793]
MKTLRIVIAAMLLMTFGQSIFAQKNTVSYPFQVQKTGKGAKAVIFIPGFGCAGQVWDETKTLFGKDYTCYTLTMAGFAGAPPAPNSTFAGWATAIATFIKNEKIQKPIIVGHSMGGALAMAIAAENPQMPEKIVVVDALPCLAALMNPSFKSNPNNDCTPIVNQMLSVSEAQFAQMQKISAASLVSDTAKQNLVVNWTLKSDRKTFAAMYCDFSNTDLREKIQFVQCPTLVLLEGNFQPIKSAIEQQYQHLKTAQLAYADKGLHFIMYDNTAWYNAQLTQFLNLR